MKKILFLKKAFTLAEVLITLGIIGIIAMTIIPVIVSEIGTRVLSVQFKKASNVLNTALRKAAYDNGSLDGYDLYRHLGEYFRLSKNCYLLNNDYSCWHDDNVVRVLQTDGSYKYSMGKSKDGAVTLDGMFLKIYPSELNCNKGVLFQNAQSATETDEEKQCYKRTYANGFCGNNFYIDINGAKGPNIRDQDIRQVYIWQDGFMYLYGEGVSAGITGHKTFTTKHLKEAAAYEPGGECYNPIDHSGAGTYD